MAKLKKGQKLVCAPCGREVVLSSAGVSETTIWCCGRAMSKKAKSVSKKKVAKKWSPSGLKPGVPRRNT